MEQLDATTIMMVAGLILIIGIIFDWPHNRKK
ncbi:hypothetical protein SAMN05192585_11241 [Acetanaerobacterium elongatum]|uniref:Uncharacterized protein n=1 Tax=Acetanaerobacterium elongatum TaxID=258515 RepID=A0A1G9YZP5_9FIRM|nr:hypothetical protein SAMN05192585_11241 [Acetanaerobacterium elongatum]